MIRFVEHCFPNVRTNHQFTNYINPLIRVDNQVLVKKEYDHHSLILIIAKSSYEVNTC